MLNKYSKENEFYKFLRWSLFHFYSHYANGYYVKETFPNCYEKVPVSKDDIYTIQEYSKFLEECYVSYIKEKYPNG